ncbi:MYB family transcription factor [Musa troglodytarum]|uniref:MYB family transcription factor n=1 Tax=Musa troglodytarum TaxID=320322 RepID=A0A9E7HIP8_9LILI|nr:MYB family transcription factor [Musa troglodytarum]
MSSAIVLRPPTCASATTTTAATIVSAKTTFSGLLAAPGFHRNRTCTTICCSMDGGGAMPAVHIGGFLSKKRYDPPLWASHLRPVPSHTFSLGHLPTPIHRWNLPNLPEDTELWIKRDDLSGMQLSGNKVRKLEFLMADAVASGADCVITVGGIQSNHCRATAVAARYLNLDCYLILRTSKVLADRDPGLIGNLLVERLVGAHIDLVSKEEYAKIGSVVKGLGYAMNTAEELRFVKDVAAATGVVLDPVYSGKAAYGMLRDMTANPTKWKKRKVVTIL